MTKKKDRPQHIVCVCDSRTLGETKGKKTYCACKAKDCSCPGCSGARKARSKGK